jgi:hypothetical protein
MRHQSKIVLFANYAMKFESLGDMQCHMLTEHMQNGDYQVPRLKSTIDKNTRE